MTAPLPESAPLEAVVLQQVWLWDKRRFNNLLCTLGPTQEELTAAVAVLASLNLIAVDDREPEPVYLPAYAQHRAAAAYHAAHGGGYTELFLQRYVRHVCQCRAFTLTEVIPLVASVKPDGRVTDTLFNYLAEVGPGSALRKDLVQVFHDGYPFTTRPQSEERIAGLIQGGLGGWLLRASFEVDTPGTLPFRDVDAYGETFLHAFEFVAERVQQHRAPDAWMTL